MDMHNLQDHWDRLGKLDPWESILYRSAGRAEPWNVEEFFATGEKEIDGALALLRSRKIRVNTRMALDFGCGAGRLTQALARRFDAVCGVDIAPSMIELANRYNRFGDRCRYVLNTVDDLSMFAAGSVDFVYSVITLQHMQPRYAKKYLAEFLRILAPGGVLMFQIPSGYVLFGPHGLPNLGGWMLRVVPKRLLDATYRKIRYGNRPRMEMYAIRKPEIVECIGQNGGRVLFVQETPGAIYRDCRYIVGKP
jgi:SAM-dependent methyltransferase